MWYLKRSIQEQFESVVEGHLDSMHFDDLIHMANERKREAKYAYLLHLENHACSTLSADMSRKQTPCRRLPPVRQTTA